MFSFALQFITAILTIKFISTLKQPNNLEINFLVSYFMFPNGDYHNDELNSQAKNKIGGKTSVEEDYR